MFLHPGQPPAPHDLWSSWNPDPLLGLGLATATLLALRARRHLHLAWFWTGLFAVALALASPIEAMSESLASAHMVQHLLLIVIAAPALVTARAGSALVAGLPLNWRRRLGAARRRLGLVPARTRRLSHPVLALAVHGGAILFWHAALPYQAALNSIPIHYLEHVSFVVTGVWFWQVVLKSREREAGGFGVLLVFGLALQSVFLALLMTFAGQPWYPAYIDTAPLWGLTALEDLHLAGVIMWVPAGLVYTGIGIARLLTWLRRLEPQEGI